MAEDRSFTIAQALKRAPRWRDVLGLCMASHHPVDSGYIHRRLGIPQSNARRILGRLNTLGAVAIVSQQKRAQLFSITKDGRKAALLVKRLLSSD